MYVQHQAQQPISYAWYLAFAQEFLVLPSSYTVRMGQWTAQDHFFEDSSLVTRAGQESLAQSNFADVATAPGAVDIPS